MLSHLSCPFGAKEAGNLLDLFKLYQKFQSWLWGEEDINLIRFKPALLQICMKIFYPFYLPFLSSCLHSSFFLLFLTLLSTHTDSLPNRNLGYSGNPVLQNQTISLEWQKQTTTSKARPAICKYEMLIQSTTSNQRPVPGILLGFWDPKQ